MARDAGEGRARAPLPRPWPHTTACTLQKQGYVSRAAFKLVEVRGPLPLASAPSPGCWGYSGCLEGTAPALAQLWPLRRPQIQKKHKVVRPGGRVLDLGCVPGAWLQVACQNLGPRDRGGLVLGIDIQASRPVWGRPCVCMCV